MAYRDDRVAMLARADALEQALDEAETKRAQVEAERDALAAEATLLRVALVRAIGTRSVRVRAAQPRGRPELAAILLLTLGFVLAAISAGGRSRGGTEDARAAPAMAAPRTEASAPHRETPGERRVCLPSSP